MTSSAMQFSYAASGRSRLTAAGGETFTYDAEGNLLQRSRDAVPLEAARP
jgi:hypothetical protein